MTPAGSRSDRSRRSRGASARPAYAPLRRVKAGVAACLVAALAIAGMLLHSGLAPSPRAADRAAIVRLAGVPDLALSSNARWLRHPSQVEPTAATADAPIPFDTEPAGALIGPPRRTSSPAVSEGARGAGR